MISFADLQLLSEINAYKMDEMYPLVTAITPADGDFLEDVVFVLGEKPKMGWGPLYTSLYDFYQASFLMNRSKTIAFCLMARSALMGNLLSRHNVKVC